MHASCELLTIYLGMAVEGSPMSGIWALIEHGIVKRVAKWENYVKAYLKYALFANLRRLRRILKNRREDVSMLVSPSGVVC